MRRTKLTMQTLCPTCIKYTSKHLTVFLRVGNMHETCPTQYNDNGYCCKIRTVTTPAFHIAQAKCGSRKMIKLTK